MTDLSSPEAMSSKMQVRPSRPIEEEEEDELDNRLTEERFQSEMAEMAKGEKERPVSILKRSASTRAQRSKESGEWITGVYVCVHRCVCIHMAMSKLLISLFSFMRCLHLNILISLTLFCVLRMSSLRQNAMSCARQTDR